MSGYNRRQGDRFTSGKANGWRKQTNAGAQWKPKIKVELDESCGGASSNKKDDASLSVECTSEKMSSLTPKPDVNPHTVEESPLPIVKNPSSGIDNIKPIQDSSQRADNVSTQPKFVSTFDSNSKDSNHMNPMPLKSQQGMESQDGIAEKGKQIGDNGGKPEDSDHSSSITRFDICPKKVNTGGVKLKTSLLEKNREKRNLAKRAAEGPNINILRPGMVLMKGYISYDDQVELDESCGGASSNQKDDASLSVECTSEKMSSLTPKPDVNPHTVEESPLPPVKNPSSAIDNFEPIPDSSLRADNVSKQPDFVSTFDSNSKDSNHMNPMPSKSQQGMESPDGIVEKGKQIGDHNEKPEDNNHSSSITRFDICPKKVKTGGITLKTSLLVKNREKRNQSKRAAEGPNINILRPGMVLMKGYISYDDQVKIVKTCRELGIGDGGFYQPGYRDGAKLHLKMMCLGRNWDPQSSQYVDTRPIDNSKPPNIPDYFQDMVKRALQDSNVHIFKNKGKFIPSMLPDICIVNFYTKSGKLGLHQDKDESRESLDKGLPVVSFSIGETAEFLYGKERDIEMAEKVNLESGDVLIFGGESRNIFHGVSSIADDTAPKSLLEATDMRPGRLNLTFRQF